MPPKKQSDTIDFETLKEDSLRKQLKLKKDEKFKIGELQKANKTEVGEQFQFHDKTFKMTPLLKKRITLAITLIRASKRKNVGQFAKKNKGKATPKNPIDPDLLTESAMLYRMGKQEFNDTTIGINQIGDEAQAKRAMETPRARGGLVFKDFNNPEFHYLLRFHGLNRPLNEMDRKGIMEMARDIDDNALRHQPYIQGA